MSRQSIVAPLGLISQPNKYGQYKRGALSYAKNVCMRAPGVISSLPATRTYRSAIANGAGRVIRRVYAAPASLLVATENLTGNAGFKWVTSGGVVEPTLPTGYNNYPGVAGALRIASQRKRFLYTTWKTAAAISAFKSVITADSEGATSFRCAGLTPVAQVAYLGNTTTDAGVLTPPFSVAYRAVVRRTQDDGYVMVSGACSAIEAYQQAGATRDSELYILFAESHNYQAGDVLELYRSRVQTPETVSAGDTVFLAVSTIISSTDIANGYIYVRDTCPEFGLGAELYSNPGQEGATAANFDPPASSDMALFKGHMFYAAIATPAQAVVAPRIAYGYLDTNSKRLFGIGRRDSTGNFTSGSPTITAVNNIRGYAVGQFIYHATLFPAGFTTIIGVTATTITCAVNATGTSAAASFYSIDTLEPTVPPNMVTPTKFVYPFELNNAALAAGLTGTPFCVSSNLALRMRSDALLTGEAAYGMEFIYRRPRVTDYAFTLRASNGLNYSPAIPDINGGTPQSFSPDVKENRYAWSKYEQPEAVPPLNYGFAGSGTVLRMIPTRDALWFFCTDGLFRLSGDGGDGSTAWRLDPADPNLLLTGRNAVATLKETIWCYSNRGLVSVSDESGIKDISLGTIGDLIPGDNFSDTWDVTLECDQLHQEVWLMFRTGTPGAGTTTTYVFNTVTKSFVGPIISGEWSTMVWVPYLKSLAIAETPAGSPNGNPNVIYFEDDTSNNRLSGVDVRYQPLYVDDPFALKQFQSIGYIWQSMNASATITPTYGGVASKAFAVNQSSGESRSTAGVPRFAAIAPGISPGFTMSDVVAPWSLRGISAQFVDLGEESERD